MDNQNLDLRAFVGLLRGNVALIAVIAGICLAAAFALATVLEPVYTATALVLVDPTHEDILSQATTQPLTTLDSSRVDAEVPLVTAQSTLLGVIDKLKLAQNDAFLPKAGKVGGACWSRCIWELPRFRAPKM
ncbi:MAG TPA: Wzz/FepE/Etk N-terminal domain-containing protein [Devosiaceae bacterium]|nr:Wzz/FepE/Etk N-terminal domain-containing protein [Devosiaceae bacterium]